MTTKTPDYAEADRKFRRDMVDGSERLLAALCHYHPRIIAHLQRNQQNRSCLLYTSDAADE